MAPLDKALDDFRQRPFDLPLEADECFAKFGVGNTIEAVDRPYERFSALLKLLGAIKAVDQRKFSWMHKGTPYFFLAYFCFDLRSYEKALFYLDAALNEDSGSFATWHDAPGAHFFAWNRHRIIPQAM